MFASLSASLPRCSVGVCGRRSSAACLWCRRRRSALRTLERPPLLPRWSAGASRANVGFGAFRKLRDPGLLVLNAPRSMQSPGITRSGQLLLRNDIPSLTTGPSPMPKNADKAAAKRRAAKKHQREVNRSRAKRAANAGGTGPAFLVDPSLREDEKLSNRVSYPGTDQVFPRNCIINGEDPQDSSARLSGR
jgi:hypothetical protein